VHGQTWAGVGTIVVGEEGSKSRRWREAFVPLPGVQEQSLPTAVAERESGWYYVRFYDINGSLVESMDFRLVCALKSVAVVPQSSLFSSKSEHGLVQIRFRHEPDFTIRPADGSSPDIQHGRDGTTIIVPPEPDYDRTQWYIGSEGKTQTAITILIERLWWAVEQEDTEPHDWKDELLSLTCDDFAATSRRALWLRLPAQRWADSVGVGFEYSRARRYDVKVTKREIAIPLRDFCDCQEIATRERDQFLSIWFERNGGIVGANIAIIPASKGAILCIGSGRKKSAVAAAILRRGTGSIRVNGCPVQDYFRRAPLKAQGFLQRLLELPFISKELATMEVSIEVKGSNPTTMQQARASAHALAHALMRYDPQLRPLLQQEGFGGAKVAKPLDVG
jgi:small subunit ribosomal protein S9